MKILQVCNFSSGISGVWTRVLEDSLEFIKRGHEVWVFSSDETENGEKALSTQEIKEGIDITRFPVKRRKGYALWFDFEDDALKLQPDVIICHGLRKPYLGPAVEVARLVKAKCFLVTHAPFIDKELRGPVLNSLIWLYDKFKGKKIMNSFNKVISICKWEKQELTRLGCDERRIRYIPNSLSEDFFNREATNPEKKIIFMGRMHPVKEIEVLLKAFKESNLKEYSIEIISSLSGDYYESLLKLVEELGLNEKVVFTDAIYETKEKINKLDSAEIFVLSSKKESLPFGIIEAMARGKIVIATKTKGSLELIKNKRDGFLFDVGSVEQLKDLFDLYLEISEESKNRIREMARNKSQEFNINKVMNQWEEIIK